MNRRMILYMPLQIIKLQAVVMLIPAAIGFIYHEKSAMSFVWCAAGALAVSFAVSALIHPQYKKIYAKEGFVIVALTWVLMSVLGAMPFVISGEIPSFADALFESVSGFTTTGASILRDVEAMSRGMLFWRSFTHWLGGMGILVFVMAIVNLSDTPIHIMRAEMPGPIVGKLAPKAKQTAKILYILYIALTVLEIIFLKFGGMTLFESTVHALATAGTGGFGIKNTSVGGYSPYIQWVITVFMALFGVNFNVYFLLTAGKIKSVLKSSEMWMYFGIMAAGTGIIIYNTSSFYENISDLIRHSAFQVSSIMTTTGFSTTDFNKWPGFSKAVLMFLMVCGACAGSTAGGLKVSRIQILIKALHREFTKMAHPRSVSVLRLEGRPLDEGVINNCLTYFVLYCIINVVCIFLISVDKFNLETSISATLACINNIGPAFGAAGPCGNYADFSVFSKLVLAAGMLLGRLEIFPVLLAVSPATWVKK
ncbi:MAG: TrkH family potassium uptake protein [Clostridia bacterium]|nr:TrkH family potassium uptake protein [Clostridia bacterium]